MQRMFLLLSILLPLYATGVELPLDKFPTKPTPAEISFVAVSAVLVPIAPPIESHAIEVLPNATPHLALLLPLQDKNFSDAASAVQAGFMAAASLNIANLPVRTYSNFDESGSVVAAYHQAIANGAQVVVGPLTRKGVGALAAESNIPVPTLALNYADLHAADNLYFFGLSADAEARAVAALAARPELRQAIVITGSTSLAQRMQFAFEEAWSASGRSIIREIEFKEDIAVLSGLSNTPNTMVFIAADALTARQIRPYLPNKLPVYGTSQLFAGNDDALTNYDLGGVRFVDMPWLLQPDLPAVSQYPHAALPLSADKERLYALGIDAYRLAQLLYAHKLSTALPLQGVTGQINLSEHNLQRTAIDGIFVQGRAQASSAALQPAVQMFPDQFKTKP